MTPKYLAQAWDETAEQWQRLGYDERALECRALADYWRLPFWRRIVGIFGHGRALRAVQQYPVRGVTNGQA